MCFDDAAAAAAYACGRDYPQTAFMVDAAGSPAAVVIECTGTADASLQLRRSVNDAVVGTSSLTLSPPACDTLEWHTFYPFSWSAADGAAMAGAVAGVWLVGWGFKAVFAVLRGRRGGEAAEEE